MAYTPTSWTNDAGQAINATNLNKIEYGIASAHNVANIKTWYESNANTNVLTDAYKAILDGYAVALGAIEADITTNTGDITALEADNVTINGTLTTLGSRTTDLETTVGASHDLLVTATSLATSQEPSTTDTALQLEFGALQTTTNVDVAVTGAITFKVAGKYILSPFFQYGRTGGAGISILLNRYLINGTQIGSSLSAKIDNASTLVPWSSSIILEVEANDVLTIEIMRDSTGNDSGGLFKVDPTLAGWNDAPCASIQIYRAS